MLRRTKTEEEMGMKIYKFKLYGAMWYDSHKE